MIYVNRNAVPAPSILSSKRSDAARDNAKRYFSRSFFLRSQERFEFDPKVYAAITVAAALSDLFHRKCAYCESRIGEASNIEIDHFRPKSQPVGINQSLRYSKGTRADGYWWLVYEWENLYSACPVCNRNKQNHFPIAKRRAQPGAMGGKLLAERGLLLDPCVDEPQTCLEFLENGEVRSRASRGPSLFDGYDRGSITIDILGLNRTELVESRARVAKETRLLFDTIEMHPTLGLETLERIRVHLELDRPYLALRRQMLEEWTKETLTKRDSALWRLHAGSPQLQLIQDTLIKLQRYDKPLSGTRSSTKIPRSTVNERSNSKHREQRNRLVHGVSTPFIQSIDIQNFRAIKRLHLEFHERKSTQASWQVLLGENGTGKSSVLQAVALALIGPSYLKRSGVKPGQLLRKLRNGKRVKQGVVRIKLSTERLPLDFRFNERGFTYSPSPHNVHLFLRAYGSTRRLPRRPLDAPTSHPLMRVAPLFDPGLYVFDVSMWMRRLSQNRFNSAALTVKDLLELDSGEPLRRTRSGINTNIGGVRVELNELSDGYQSVLAMAADIVAGAPEKMHDMRSATGIVLLDEIDAHLHPRWKMRIVSRLRRAFPRLQFLVTTHEPLCLRGLEDNEITLMRREGRDIRIEQDLPSPRGLRVDQILTSPLFGLGSTIDPDLDRDFMDYYALLLEPEATITNEQVELRATLKARLEPYRVLGNTVRDKLIAEVIDEYLAKEISGESIDPLERMHLRDVTKKRVAEIWRQVNLPAGELP
jgi:uncharacterized protein (TIGR02646 family)